MNRLIGKSRMKIEMRNQEQECVWKTHIHYFQIFTLALLNVREAVSRIITISLFLFATQAYLS